MRLRTKKSFWHQKRFSIGILSIVFALFILSILIFKITPRIHPLNLSNLAHPFQRTYEDGYRDGLAFSKDRMAKLGCLSALLKPVTEMNGILKAIDGNRLTFELPAKKLDPLGDGTTQRIIVVTDKTVINKYTAKSSDQLYKEGKEFEKARAIYEEKTGAPMPKVPIVDLPPDAPRPPSFAIITVASLKDIKVGDDLRFTAVKDLRQNKESEAILVDFMDKAPAPKIIKHALPPEAPKP